MNATEWSNLDPGLLERFRKAGASIAWRGADGTARRGHSPAAPPKAEIAHLNEEEARVEREARGKVVRVDSGPVGALVLILEIDRRGPPTSLTASAAGGRFPGGALEGRWSAGPTLPGQLPLSDLVGLARYALA